MRNSFLLTGSILAAIGCVPDGDGRPIGEARLAITMAPSDVACIRFVVTSADGSPAIVDKPATPGTTTAAFDLGRLPLGEVTFTGFAYTVACASLTGATVAGWVADPVAATLRAGVLAHVTLDFRLNNPVEGTANFISNLVTLTGGGFEGATYAIYRSASGTSISGWGAAVLPSNPPTNLQQISAGQSTQCLLTDEGSGVGDVYCWGTGGLGQLGPSGSGSNNPTTLYFIMGGATRIVSGGWTHCARSSADGRWYCWGYNGNGQITGTTTPSSFSVPQATALGESMSIGQSHRCWVALDGGVSCRGNNSFAELGSGTTSGTSSFNVLNAGSQVVLGEHHSCAIRSDGAVRCWGANGEGQVGNGTNLNAFLPSPVSLGEDAVALAAARVSTCALLQSGAVRCWGSGDEGQMGLGACCDVPAPVPVDVLTDVKAIYSSPASEHFCAVKNDQTVWCWGRNSRGQLGDATNANRFLPVRATAQ